MFGTILFYSLDISFFIVFQNCIDHESWDIFLTDLLTQLI